MNDRQFKRDNYRHYLRRGIASFYDRVCSYWRRYRKGNEKRVRLWSDNPREWGIIPLSYYIPRYTEGWEERNGTMTDEQEVRLMKMKDQKLLIELAIAYGNTEDADLGSYHRKNILSIFADLNVEHIDSYRSDSERKGESKHVEPL